MPGATKTIRKGTPKASLKPKKTSRKSVNSPAAPTVSVGYPSSTRRVRMPKHQLRVRNRLKHPFVLPSAWKIAKQARQLIFQHWKVIGGVVLVYGVLNMVLVRGLSGGANVSQLKSAFDSFFHGTLGHLASGFTIFALLVSSTTTTSGANGATTYQSLLLVVVSLALVWAYRQLLAGKKIRIRDAYYRGMYPVIPVILILMVIGLELVPLSLGGWLFSTVIQNGIAVTGSEKFVWGLVFLVLALLSIYLVCSSLFALYIATLPDMTPMKALRSARELVRYRRWSIIRKVLFLPLWVIIVGSLVMLPFILFVPVAAQWIFFGLTMLAVAVVQAYMYTLYRELLNEKTAG